MKADNMSITETKDFKHSLHCLDCAYENLGYNGSFKCLPKTRSCKPIYPYDWMIQSQIRKIDIMNDEARSRDGSNEMSSVKMKRRD
jgi:hypothetical protein